MRLLDLCNFAMYHGFEELALSISNELSALCFKTLAKCNENVMKNGSVQACSHDKLHILAMPHKAQANQSQSLPPPTLHRI